MPVSYAPSSHLSSLNKGHRFQTTFVPVSGDDVAGGDTPALRRFISERMNAGGGFHIG